MTSYYPAKEIVKGLWIGSKGDSLDAAFAKDHDVRLVVNCTRNLGFSFPGINRVRVPVDDACDENATMLRNLPITTAAIDAVLQHGHGAVLVHCYAGMQRSATVVAAYLMWKRGMTAERAMRFVRSKKSETFRPYPTFRSALLLWENHLCLDKIRRARRVKPCPSQAAKDFLKTARAASILQRSMHANKKRSPTA